MKLTHPWLVQSTRALGAVALLSLPFACGDDDDDEGAPSDNGGQDGGGRGGGGAGGTTGGSGGSGAGGRAGSTGASGAGGRAGSSGSGGRAGSGAAANGGSGGRAGASAGASGSSDGDDAGVGELSFFVSSDTSVTGKLGGLAGADERCQRLADAVSAGRTFHAYLSADDGAVNARDRIGTGPWYNAKGVLLAQDLDSLHERTGDANVFLDEKGEKINGQWTGSPMPNEHDILTGSKADGTLEPGKTCKSWTSDSADDLAIVGHSDGLGPMQANTGMYVIWNASHENGGCNDTAPRGGAGRIYCFAIDE